MPVSLVILERRISPAHRTRGGPTLPLGPSPSFGRGNPGVSPAGTARRTGRARLRSTTRHGHDTNPRRWPRAFGCEGNIRGWPNHRIDAVKKRAYDATRPHTRAGAETEVQRLGVTEDDVRPEGLPGRSGPAPGVRGQCQHYFAAALDRRGAPARLMAATGADRGKDPIPLRVSSRPPGLLADSGHRRIRGPFPERDPRRGLSLGSAPSSDPGPPCPYEFARGFLDRS